MNIKTRFMCVMCGCEMCILVYMCMYRRRGMCVCAGGGEVGWREEGPEH